MPSGRFPDAVTSDGHGIALDARPDGRVQLLWDGQGGEPFTGFVELRDKTSAIFASDDGAHLAYAAERDGLVFVGRDDREYAPFERLSRSVPPVFSHKGEHLAYAAGSSAGEYSLLVDGDIVSTMPLAPIKAVFSPSGDRLAFVEMRAVAGGDHEVRIVLDGAPGDWFSGMRNADGAMQFSPDGRRFAFHRIDEKGRDQWIVDGEAQRFTNEVRTIGLAQLRGIGVIEPARPACFSPDGRRFAYAADVVEKGVAVLEDDVAGPLFKAVGMPVFSPDSSHLAYVAETYSKTFCSVVDGTPGPEWKCSSVGTPVFSPDSRHVAVTFLREEGSFLRKRRMVGCVVDGSVLAEVPGDDFRQPMFSPDGERVAWIVGNGDAYDIMVDGSSDADGQVAHSAPIYTRAGHLVYAVIIMPDRRRTVMIDRRLGPLASELLPPRSILATFEYPRSGHPNIPFAVSPDGEHVAWAGVFEEEARPVLNESVGPPFDLLLDWSFDPDGRAVWWAQRADTVYRVSVRMTRTEHVER
jgi:hypothetical protein